MRYQVEVERTVRHRIMVTVAAPEGDNAHMVRTRAEAHAASMPDSTEWNHVHAPIYVATGIKEKS